jgi:hypothetical protein
MGFFFFFYKKSEPYHEMCVPSERRGGNHEPGQVYVLSMNKCRCNHVEGMENMSVASSHL